GAPEHYLVTRERELLEMVACAVNVDPSFGMDLRYALTDAWELCADSCPVAPLGSDDGIALNVLLELGLLPARPGLSWEDPLARLGPVLPTDPILSIVDSFHRAEQI